MMVRSADSIELVEVAGGPRSGSSSSVVGGVRVSMPTQPWAVVLFTDGLFEGRTSASGGRLGEEGLIAAARGLLDAGSERFVDELIQHAQRASEGFGGMDDDLAVLHVQWR